MLMYRVEHYSWSAQVKKLQGSKKDLVVEHYNTTMFEKVPLRLEKDRIVIP